MNVESSSGKTAEVVIERVFDAPRDLVWAVWTEPEHAKHWWGPEGYTTPVYECDLRPGGVLLIHMRAPDGEVSPITGIVEEVVPPERFVASGGVEIAGEVAFEARTIVTFEALGEKTKVVVRQVYTNLTAIGSQAVGGAQMGWHQQHEKLAAYLATVAR